MDDVEGLIEELRGGVIWKPADGDDHEIDREVTEALMDRAASALTRLHAIEGERDEAISQPDEARKALEPFALIAENHLGAPFDDEHIVHLADVHGFITELFVRPFRRARSLLSKVSSYG